MVSVRFKSESEYLSYRRDAMVDEWECLGKKKIKPGGGTIKNIKLDNILVDDYGVRNFSHIAPNISDGYLDKLSREKWSAIYTHNPRVASDWLIVTHRDNITVDERD